MGGFSVDRAGIHCVRRAAYAIDVDFDGRRIWSFIPARDGHSRGRETLVPWPVALRAHLKNGYADVTLRRVESGQTLFSDRVTFGEGDEPISLVNAKGLEVSLDKAGHLTPSFNDTSDDVKGEYVEAVTRGIAHLTAMGAPAFLGFGGLLGAVRTGHFIGHDTDADICYLASSTHPLDILLESMRLEHGFCDAGWVTMRMSGGCFKLQVPMSNDSVAHIDVFTAFYFDGQFHMMPCVVGDVPRSALLPTSMVELEGRQVPAPHEPEALLVATYGDGWRVPDPSFHFEVPDRVSAFFDGYLRGNRNRQKHWNERFVAGGGDLEQPSPFASWFAARQPADAGPVLDIGCGGGADAVWLTSLGYDVQGFDYSFSALQRARALALKADSSARFRPLNLYNARVALSLGALLGRDAKPGTIYAHALADTLDDEGRKNLWRFARLALHPRKGRLFLEFRTPARVRKHAKPAFPWSPIAPAQVASELARYGFRVEETELVKQPAYRWPHCRLTAILESD